MARRGGCSASVMPEAPESVDSVWQTVYSADVTSERAEMRDRPGRQADPQGLPRRFSTRDDGQRHEAGRELPAATQLLGEPRVPGIDRPRHHRGHEERGRERLDDEGEQDDGDDGEGEQRPAKVAQDQSRIAKEDAHRPPASHARIVSSPFRNRAFRVQLSFF